MLCRRKRPEIEGECGRGRKLQCLTYFPFDVRSKRRTLKRNTDLHHFTQTFRQFLQLKISKSNFPCLLQTQSTWKRSARDFDNMRIQMRLFLTWKREKVRRPLCWVLALTVAGWMAGPTYWGFLSFGFFCGKIPSLWDGQHETPQV